MNNKDLGKIIKKLREYENITQDDLAKSLGYTNKSTIAKIEAGVSDMTYAQLKKLFDYYHLPASELFVYNNKDFSAKYNNSDLFISFSARKDGNCDSIINYIKCNEDTVVSMRNLNYHACSNCKYECFINECKYRNDAIYPLFDSFKNYNKVYLVIPMYSGNASSLYYIFNERSQDFFNANESLFEEVKKKIRIILIYGSDEESQYYKNQFKGWVKEQNQILPIERHKYNQKMNDSILEIKEIKQAIDNFKRI